MASSTWQSLLNEVNSEQKGRLERLVLENQLACLRGTREEAAPENPLHSRIGGSASLPQAIPYPCDRSGRQMMLIALLNFAQLPPCSLNLAKQGILLLFWNAARDSSNPKDRNAFKCIWLPDLPKELVAAPDDAAQICAPCTVSFAASYSVPASDSFWNEHASERDLRELLDNRRSDESAVQLFGVAGDQFELLQEIAAFSGNGISWSQARRKDSCFSHLVDNAREWRLFLRIKSSPECGLDLGIKSMNLMIRQEDLDAFRYDKVWLVVA